MTKERREELIQKILKQGQAGEESPDEKDQGQGADSNEKGAASKSE